ncbi:acid protease, partial [Thozetella sp. PMI_491]
RRQDDVDLKKQLDGTSYTIELGLGTPAQSVVVQLDTGSTDFWVNPNCANINTATSTSFCNSLPRFTPADSSTFKSLGESYQLRYGSGNASIDWATETIALGAGKITGQQFGVASNSFSEPFGILGIGPNIGGSHPQYSFFIDTLATQGLTASRAFSLDLRGIESTDGSIIFGGIDTKKYSGALEKLPIIPESEAPDGNRYWVSLDGIDLVSDSGVSTAISSTPIAVLLDSGSTMSTLPVSVFNAIAKNFPTATLDASGLYTVDCAVTSQAGTVDFTFAGKTIKVAYKDFVWHAGSFCVLGVEGSDTAIPILGDTFLRAAFVVFDQDNQNIHIAQAADCGSNLVAITKGADAVPSQVGDCGASSST